MIKVGVSNDPSRRIQSVKAKGDLSIVFAIQHEKAAEIEKHAHNLLALLGKHVTGEWFKASPAEASEAVTTAVKIAEGTELPLAAGGLPAGRIPNKFKEKTRGDKVSITFWVESSMRKKVKIKAAKTGRTVQEIVGSAIEDAVSDIGDTEISGHTVAA
jgi:hypothetical protein